MEQPNDIHPATGNRGLTNTARLREGRLTISRVTFQTARAFTAWTHGHTAAPIEAEFVLGVRHGDATLAGVVFAGPPSSWRDDDGATVEILCLATDGTPGTERALLGAVWWAARLKGYQRMLMPVTGSSVTRGTAWTARTVGGHR